MKKRVMSAVMAAALTAGVCVPARAVGAVQAAGGMSGMAAMLLAGQAVSDAAGAPSAPPEQTVHTIGLVGLERTVREKNPTPQIPQKDGGKSQFDVRTDTGCGTDSKCD